MHDWGDWNFWGSGCAIGAGLGTLLLIGLIGLAVWLGMSLTRGGVSVSRGNDAALHILEGRFARGELESQEYEEMRRTLRS